MTPFDSKQQTVLQMPDLVAFWDFGDENFVSIAPDQTRLQIVREAPIIETNGGRVWAELRAL